MLLEERDDDREKFSPIVDLVAIAMLMVGACIFLKIYAATTKELFKGVKNIFIPLYELEIKLWLHADPPFHGSDRIKILYVDSKTAFPIYETYNVFRT